MAAITDLFATWTTTLADYVEIVAALIIVGAVVEAFARAVIVFVHRNLPAETKEAVRLGLGRWLALALEFELAADILRTAIAPTWNQIGLLAAIIGLRTVLNYFLQKEIDRALQRQGGSTVSGAPLRPPSDGARSVASRH